MQRKIFIPEGLTVNHPFFYIIQHISSGRLYAGYCCCKRYCDSTLFMTEDGYRTSSKSVKELITSDGLDSFRVRKIKHFKTGKLAERYEGAFLLKVNARSNPIFFNQTNGAIDYCENGPEVSIETRKKHSDALTGSLFWNNGTINTRAKECPGDDWVLGKLQSDRSFKKMSDTQKGFRFWNDGTTNKKCKNNPGDGWVLGKLFTPQQQEHRKDINKGSKYWNNGIENTSSKTCPGEGWVLGKLFTDEYLNRISGWVKGKTYWNNGVRTIRAKDCPGEGWVLGIYMTPEQKEVNINKSKGKKRWNNGVIERMFTEDCSPPPEWVKGGLKRKS